MLLHAEMLRVIVIVSTTLLQLACAQQNYRLCVLESNNSNKKFSKSCQMLNKSGSKTECVYGNSRLDCMKKIVEGKADFGVFQAEDLLVASTFKTRPDILVINEVRFLKKYSFEYEIVPVVRKSANITRAAQLQDKRLCHPGHELGPKFTKVLAKYFESRVVPQTCDQDISITENEVRSSSRYFRSACKAGHWSPDYNVDVKLKLKYPNLCKLCDNPYSCSSHDKYYGHKGSLLCLTDGAGDIAWARLDDIRFHFGIGTTTPAQAPAEDYSLLCADDTLAPLDSPPDGCIWLARPWSAIVAKREIAEDIQNLVMSLKTPESRSWQWALQQLLEVTVQTIVPTEAMMTPEDYLLKAPGFVNANSLAHCSPARDIRMCTKSVPEILKCNMLKQAASAFGIEPQLLCLRTESTEDCMRAVQDNYADVVVIEPDYLHMADREFGLKPLLYEFPKMKADLYNLVAVVKAYSPIRHLRDLEGKKACFSMYDGVGWNSMDNILRNKTLLPSTCPTTAAFGQFFGSSCVPNINITHDSPANLLQLCDNNQFRGEKGAFECLATGAGDVAFISWNTIRRLTDGTSDEPWARHLGTYSFRKLCANDYDQLCYLSWATPGQVMIRTNTTTVKKEEITSALLEMGNLFGKQQDTVAAFQLFGPFNGEKNILFQDVTSHFADSGSLSKETFIGLSYEKIINEMQECSHADSSRGTILSLVLMLCLLLVSV